MLEVFVGFRRDADLRALEKTLEAWNLPGLEPVAIRCAWKKFEIHRRVTAENLSRCNYILASMYSEPFEENFAELAELELAENPGTGLFIPPCIEADYVSGRVALCRKGVIKHWIEPLGSQEADVLHANAHAQAVRNAGYAVTECKTLHYRLPVASLPS